MIKSFRLFVLFLTNAARKLRDCSVIADERVEVRMAAQGALSGLIHCGLIDVTDEMLIKAKDTLRKIARKLRARREQRRALLDAQHAEREKNDIVQTQVIVVTNGNTPMPSMTAYGKAGVW